MIWSILHVRKDLKSAFDKLTALLVKKMSASPHLTIRLAVAGLFATITVNAWANDTSDADNMTNSGLWGFLSWDNPAIYLVVLVVIFPYFGLVYLAKRNAPVSEPAATMSGNIGITDPSAQFNGSSPSLSAYLGNRNRDGFTGSVVTGVKPNPNNQNDLHAGQSIQERLDLAQAYLDIGDLNYVQHVLADLASRTNENDKQAIREWIAKAGIGDAFTGGDS